MAEKVVRIGRGEYGSVFCKIEWKGGNLSISGVEGPKRNGDCLGSCGQIVDHIVVTEFAPGWDKDLLAQFVAIWKEWHLNDMQPGCEHQREWDTGKELELINYKWSGKYRDYQSRAASGELSPDEYAEFTAITPAVYAAAINTSRPRYENDLVKRLLAEGWIVPDKTESRRAGWAEETEHPEGLLCKPCPVCEHKYGTSWLRKEVPQDVIDFLFNLPDADITPAWV